MMSNLFKKLMLYTLVVSCGSTGLLQADNGSRFGTLFRHANNYGNQASNWVKENKVAAGTIGFFATTTAVAGGLWLNARSKLHKASSDLTAAQGALPNTSDALQLATERQARAAKDFESSKQSLERERDNLTAKVNQLGHQITTLQSQVHGPQDASKIQDLQEEIRTLQNSLRSQGLLYREEREKTSAEHIAHMKSFMQQNSALSADKVKLLEHNQSLQKQITDSSQDANKIRAEIETLQHRLQTKDSSQDASAIQDLQRQIGALRESLDLQGVRHNDELQAAYADYATKLSALSKQCTELEQTRKQLADVTNRRKELLRRNIKLAGRLVGSRQRFVTARSLVKEMHKHIDELQDKHAAALQQQAAQHEQALLARELAEESRLAEAVRQERAHATVIATQKPSARMNSRDMQAQRVLEDKIRGLQEQVDTYVERAKDIDRMRARIRALETETAVLLREKGSAEEELEGLKRAHAGLERRHTALLAEKKKADVLLSQVSSVLDR